MATTAATPSGQDLFPDATPERTLTALVVWHLVLVVAALASTATVWLQPDSAALWIRVLLTIILILTAGSSGAAAYFLLRRQHRGRIIAIAVNYLGFLATLIVLLHRLGVFLGIDALAGNFSRGLVFLVVLAVGFRLRSLGNETERSPRLHPAGTALLVIGAAGFFIAVGGLTGLATLAGRVDTLLDAALTVAALLFVVMLILVWRRPVADALGVTIRDSEMISGYLFLSPNLLGFLIFFAGPLLLSLYVSFTDWDAFGTRNWIGLANYGEILNLDFARLASPDQLASEVLDTTVFAELGRVTIFGNSFIVGAEDKLFWLAMRNTLVFAALAVPLSVLPALLLANLLNSKIPGMTFFRAVYFLPSVAAVVGIALVWQWLFNSTVGYINYAVALAVDGLNALFGDAIVDPQVRWLSDSSTALLAVVVMSAWQWVGFNTVLFLAGLQSIPRTLYEAATVDGAGTWTKFRSVTLPLLAPTTFFVITTTIIQSMQVFEQIFILIPTNPAGPDNSTLSMVLYLYQKGFQRFEQGYASAIAWVLFLLIFSVTILRFQRERNAGISYDT